MKVSEKSVTKQNANEDVQRSVTSQIQEVPEELLELPELPFSVTKSTRMNNEGTLQSAHDKEEEKDVYDDGNNETDVEETDDEDDVHVHDHSKRSQGSDISFTPVGFLRCAYMRLARMETQHHAEQEMMQQMQKMMQQMQNMMQQMQNMMQQMQTELGRQQVIQPQMRHIVMKQPFLEADISNLCDNLVSRLEHSLEHHLQQESQRLQEFLKASDARCKQRDELLHWNMMGVVSRTMDIVSNVVISEMKQTVFPDQLYMRQSMEQMETAGQKFLQNVEQMETLLFNVKQELSREVARAVSGIKDGIVSDVRKMMKEELASAIKEHEAISDRLTAYLRTLSIPVPLISDEEHRKERIAQELCLGRINEAFQCALSAQNLDLVVYTCEAADPYIFDKCDCPLTQPVLLLLIDQLSLDLDKSFDLKMKYLGEAVMNLDVSQIMKADNIPKILEDLIQKLLVAEAHEVDVRKSRSIKMLLMLSKSLL